MPTLSAEIYLPIATALCGVIVLLWSRMDRLYGELIKNARAMDTLAPMMEAASKERLQIIEALERLARVNNRSESARDKER